MYIVPAKVAEKKAPINMYEMVVEDKSFDLNNMTAKTIKQSEITNVWSELPNRKSTPDIVLMF